tara:strand:- start:21666 stop:21893 length:228 start_codon:yes stop_codon:yes gene_type:complete
MRSKKFKIRIFIALAVVAFAFFKESVAKKRLVLTQERLKPFRYHQNKRYYWLTKRSWYGTTTQWIASSKGLSSFG